MTNDKRPREFEPDEYWYPNSEVHRLDKKIAQLEAKYAALKADADKLAAALDQSCKCTYKKVAENDWVITMAVDVECLACKTLAEWRAKRGTP